MRPGIKRIWRLWWIWTVLLGADIIWDLRQPHFPMWIVAVAIGMLTVGASVSFILEQRLENEVENLITLLEAIRIYWDARSDAPFHWTILTPDVRKPSRTQHHHGHASSESSGRER